LFALISLMYLSNAFNLVLASLSSASNSSVYNLLSTLTSFSKSLIVFDMVSNLDTKRNTFLSLM